MPRDFGTWGFILSVLALFLMYPVGIFINLTSPAFQRLLARRSRSATITRLEKVIRLHASVRDEQMVSVEVDNILIAIQNAIGIIGLGLIGILMSMVVLSFPSLILVRAVAHRSIAPVVLFVPAVGVPILYTAYRVLEQMVRYRDRVSPMRRAEMEREIGELSDKLHEPRR
jgi:hypothetical protein